MHTGFLRSALALGLLVAAPPLALAQGSLGDGPGPINNFAKSGAQAPKPRIAPPPALPGATSAGSAAPATRAPTDMEPTDALFDAINRGDIGAARDALNRGADLHGHNVLGMTPLELSVDLGRNDISFLLLSMRGTEDGRSPSAVAVAAPTKPATRQAKQVVSRPTARVAAVAPAPTQTARLYSGDGGTPNPSAGFLGFDSSRR